MIWTTLLSKYLLRTIILLRRLRLHRLASMIWCLFSKIKINSSDQQAYLFAIATLIYLIKWWKEIIWTLRATHSITSSPTRMKFRYLPKSSPCKFNKSQLKQNCVLMNWCLSKEHTQDLITSKTRAMTNHCRHHACWGLAMMHKSKTIWTTYLIVR